MPKGRDLHRHLRSWWRGNAWSEWRWIWLRFELRCLIECWFAFIWFYDSLGSWRSAWGRRYCRPLWDVVNIFRSCLGWVDRKGKLREDCCWVHLPLCSSMDWSTWLANWSQSLYRLSLVLMEWIDDRKAWVLGEEWLGRHIVRRSAFRLFRLSNDCFCWMITGFRMLHLIEVFTNLNLKLRCSRGLDLPKEFAIDWKDFVGKLDHWLA